MTDFINTAKLLGGISSARKANSPTQYASRQHQYLADETAYFKQSYAKYSSDYFEARMQGLNPEDPYAWKWVHMRLDDVVKTSAAMSKNFDDFKFALIDDANVEYVMQGSKVECMGSTWLAMNPMNISGADGKVLIRRCNTVWNYYDEDGNKQSEPIIAESLEARASAIDPQEVIRITTGYFNIICQYNDATRQIDVNTRIALGRNIYRVQGFSDFIQEYTGDYESVHLLEFAVYYEEPNLEVDDMQDHIANGLVWDQFLEPKDKLL